MSVYSLASKINSVQIEVKSKVSKNNPTFTGTVTGITQAMVGLGNVQNTSDADKPVSIAVSNALATKANINGTATQFIKANGTFDSNTYLTTTSGTAADSSKLNGITALQLFNSMGEAHGAITSFDATTPSYDYCFRYVTGTVNGPGTSGAQF